MARLRSGNKNIGTTPDGSELFIGAKVPDARERAVAHAETTLKGERRAVRRFAARTLAFCAPLILIVLAIEALLWRVGETWPLERVIRAQQVNHSALFSRLLMDQGTFRYKYLQILRQRPRILALGSSRIMQFRSEMFGRQGSSFYNAGGMAHSFEDINAFLDRLPQDATPQIIILGIDFWWLNANAKRESIDSFAVGVDQDGTYSWQGHASLLADYLRGPRSLGRQEQAYPFASYLRGPRLLGDLFTHSLGKNYDPNAIGLQAALYRSGFRIDGSDKFDLKIPQTPEEWRRRLPSPETVRKDILGGGPNFDLHFAFTDGVSTPLMEQLRAILLRLKTRGIFLVGYSPPVINEWAQVASTAPRQKEYWRQYHENVPALFRSLDIPFYDIITPTQLGLDDRYMRDAFHAYDTFDMHVLLYFCNDPQIRALLPDVPQVARQALASPRTNPLYLDLSDRDVP